MLSSDVTSSRIRDCTGLKSQSFTTAFAGYAQLARELATPLQIGENFYGPRALYEAIRTSACDYVMLALMRKAE